MPLVSIVVPVYNVEVFLANCVNSVLAQSENDWELLLVDDGSTDSSGALCDKFAASDSRIHVLHRENAGVGKARNAGLAAATGKYVTFLDSDDAYTPQHLELLLAAAEKSGAEITVSALRRITEDGELRRAYRFEPAESFSPAEALKHFLCDSERVYSCWNKLIRRDFLGSTEFSSYVQGEDMLFCVALLCRCNRYTVVGEPTYLYTQRKAGATGTGFSTNRLDLIRAWSDAYAPVTAVSPALGRTVAERIVNDTDKFYSLCASLPDGERKAARSFLLDARRRFFPLRFSGVRFPVRERLGYILFCLFPRLFYLSRSKR